MNTYKRRVKLIKPTLQLKLVGTFLGMTALTLLLQYMLVTAHLTDAATRMPDGGSYLMSILPEMMTKVLLLSFLVVLPLMFCVGVLTTFRIAGPVYHFEQYLAAVARGEETGPCRLRKGDELWDLCDRINEATAALRHPKLPLDEDRAEDQDPDSLATNDVEDVASLPGVQ
jgi:hypothetical protein